MASDSWSFFAVLICFVCVFAAEGSDVMHYPKLRCGQLCSDWPSLDGLTLGCTITAKNGGVQFIARKLGLMNWKFYLVNPQVGEEYICSLAKRGDEFSSNSEGQVCSNGLMRHQGSRGSGMRGAAESSSTAATTAASASPAVGAAAPTAGAPAKPVAGVAAPGVPQAAQSESVEGKPIKGLFSNVMSSITNSKFVKPLDILKNVTGVAKDMVQSQKPGDSQAVNKRADLFSIRESFLEPLLTAVRNLLSALVSDEMSARRSMFSGNEMKQMRAADDDVTSRPIFICRILKELVCLEKQIIKCLDTGECCYQPLHPTTCFEEARCVQKLYDILKGVKF